jgi:molybdate transport system substrate-binding protein
VPEVAAAAYNFLRQLEKPMRTKSPPLKLCLVIYLVLSILASSAEASPLAVAVASNFSGAMENITRVFSRETGIAVKPVYASTGKLYAMIENGGPFDLFLAADTARPRLLYTKGLAQQPFVYAIGEAVLWTNIDDLCSAQNWQEALRRYKTGQIVIANPAFAPYGTEALEALSRNTGPELKKRLVYSQNIAQAFSLAHKVTGLGFTAASLVHSGPGRQGCYWPVEQAKKVEQSACALTRSTRKAEVKSFTAFLVSSQAKSMLTDFGYK